MTLAALRLALAEARRVMVYAAGEIRETHEQLDRLGVPAYHEGEPLSLCQRARMVADRYGPQPSPTKPVQPDPEAWRAFY